jgi:zinc transport system substrate-binding protein
MIAVLRLIPILILLFVGLAGCGNGPASSEETVVAASFYPLAYAAEEIAGTGVRVDNLTPPGVEPHDLEISPADVEAIRAADLVLLLGHGFQPQLEDAAGAGRNVVRLLDAPGLDLHANGDPHVWLDPIRYARLVERIGSLLRGEQGAARLFRRLHALDGDFRSGLADCARRDIVTSHEAFGYLAERYELEEISISGVSPEAEPDPGKLREVVDLIRKRGVTTVYFETLVSPRIAETVARETGASTAILDPIEGLTRREQLRGEDYFSRMYANLEALRKGLGCH